MNNNYSGNMMNSRNCTQNSRGNMNARNNMDGMGCMNDRNRMDGMNRMNRMDGMNNMNRMNRSNMGSEVVSDKKRLMMNVYELGFIMTETLLYLDTHPDDTEALAYFNKMKPRYQEAVAMYEKHCGPLNFTSVESDNYWTWVATPMPWEREGC